MPLLSTPRWWDGRAIVARRGRSSLLIAVKGGGLLARRRRRQWEDLATTTSKRLIGSGEQGGDNDNDVDPRGDDYNDTTISLAMATATRVAGDKECNGGKSDGDDEKGCGQETTTAPKRAVAATATRAAGDKEGDGNGGESDGDAYEESNGGSNDPSTQEHPQLRAKKTTMTMTARQYHRNDNGRRGSHKPGGIAVSR